MTRPLPKGRYPTPLRYPGGKQRLGRFFEKIVRLNGFEGSTYIEPFAGGAGVAMHLLERGLVERVHLNDVDRSIYAFWYAATRRTESLCRIISQKRVSVAEWDRQKEVQKQKESAALLDLGFSTLFLNRTNVSGILSGGIIGGRAQVGAWKIGARYNKERIQIRIRKVGAYARRISLSCVDVRAERDLAFGARRRSFVYFDPPYYCKGPDLYLNHFADGDHAALAYRIQNHMRIPWITTYDNSPEVMGMYAESKRRFFDLAHSASRRRIGREAMFFHPCLRVPRRIS